MKLRTLVKVEIDLRQGHKGLTIEKQEITREGERTIRVKGLRKRRYPNREEVREYCFCKGLLDAVQAPGPTVGHVYFASTVPMEQLKDDDIAIRAAVNQVAGTLAAMMDDTMRRLEEVAGCRIFDREERHEE